MTALRCLNLVLGVWFMAACVALSLRAGRAFGAADYALFAAYATVAAGGGWLSGNYTVRSLLGSDGDQ